ncbi:hypothetical protein HJC23_012251 [Cyclotella cryptica]|uniref:Vacuolar protein 8 n=1 Tax=Cyclotella cryptica TaxID=29204 RepID=A0ABD3PMF6_9STRA|eukprot:CCRYP_013184-RA/>CCRYP_013184-RA protein AED:0.00 eAED:0.00 QI:750/1/1/1/1/1/3/469/3687
MSTVLESLVARGRRVKNFREQREITFGLADLSTRPDSHERLVKKGGVTTLVDLLTNSQDAEAQQFAAIAVANTASTTSLCNDIVKLEGVVSGLVQYVGNESADSIGRQYCAMAIGNLLAEPSTHEIILRLGLTVALVTMLKNCTVGRELESGRHAAFALSNLASNLHNHEQIVEQGAIELLVALACCEDLDTQRQALSALRGLCLTASNRIKEVQNGILDPLILMSASDDIDIVREVSSALNCLSSEDENKEEISYRGISTIINLMLSGDSEIERHASSAIGNLLEMPDVHSRFVEEKGVPPLISLCNSPDALCRVEATRALANLSSNPDLKFTEMLIEENSLPPLVKSLESDGDVGRFSALAIANFARNSASLFKIVHAGAVPHLVSMVLGADDLECRRYGALALANMTACETFHPHIMRAGAPEALFVLSNSPDTVSHHYVACALANLSSNITNHEPIVEMGGLQPIISLVSDPDQNIHKQAAAALRGFSASGNIKMKIVQEGGLEQLCRLLLSQDIYILRETTGCLCNLSLGDENKFEVVKSGAVKQLISLMENEDSIVAYQSCECLANIAETDNQDYIVTQGAIIPCLRAMRSRDTDVQRESGRLIANLSSSETKLAADAIVGENGHLLLVSYLLSHDTACQRAGSFGIGNLCTHDHHRVTIMKAGALEPLTSVARSEKIELEIRRFAMLAIANLAASFRNHDQFVSQGTIPMLISFSNSEDTELRNYAAYAVAQISANSNMVEIITSEGGLEPVLYLARSDDKTVQKGVLPALATLSFIDCNKVPICANGSLPAIIDCINEDKNSSEEAQLACCAVANLTEVASNMKPAVSHGCIPLLVRALSSESELVQREAARAIGNLAINIHYCDEILKHNTVLPALVSCFRGRNCECQRMATFAMSNVSSNLKSHDELFKHNILELVKDNCHASLDPKRFSDHETVRFCLLIIANLTADGGNHQNMNSFVGLLVDFTRHRDAICRQHAILALGNLCAKPENLQRHNKGIMGAMVAFSFPPSTHSLNTQFQAIAGLRGLSKHTCLRQAILQEGGLEPLILGARGNNRYVDIEIQREATATISNLALEEANRLTIAKSGALPTLVTLIKLKDTMIKMHAATALANLAETSNEIHLLLLSEQCVSPMCELLEDGSTHIDTKRSISRCLALFASNKRTHSSLLVPLVTTSIRTLVRETRDTLCERFGVLAVANLALNEASHCVLSESKLVESVVQLADSQDIETLRGAAFALNLLSKNNTNHSALEVAGAVESLVPLLRCGDIETALQACIALKSLSATCEECRTTFVTCHGLQELLALSTSDDLETKREVAAALRNISLSDNNKDSIMQIGLDVIADLCRNSDNEISHQACAIVANISEKKSNKVPMVERGIIHHLHTALLLDFILVLRESVRSFANLSSTIENTAHIVSSGALCHMARALKSDDILTRRFAALALSNLAINSDVHARIIHEVGLLLLISIATESDRSFIDMQTQQHGMACLANLASNYTTHDDLIRHGSTTLAMDHAKSTNLDVRANSLLLIANLSSKKANHSVLHKCCNLHELIQNLACLDEIVQLRAVTSLRGLSTDASMRKQIISAGGTESLLSLIDSSNEQFKLEVLSTLCNLSLSGCMGNMADAVLETVDMPTLIAFLCNTDSMTHRMFGAVAIGNIASHINLQGPVFDSGALKPLIELSDNTGENDESQRCMAYAICNLTAEPKNRLPIITKGGVASILYLCRTGDISDMLAALSTLRGLAASDDTRRLLFEEGMLYVLFLAVKSGNSQCKHEAASLFATLSLNEGNKFDLAQSNEIEVLASLLDETDVSCVTLACRGFGNICEVHELHSEMLHHLAIERLIRLISSDGTLKVEREVIRIVVNFSSNFAMHNEIAQPMLMNNLLELCSETLVNVRREGDAHEHKLDIIRLSALAFANISMNGEVHKKFDINKMLLMSYEIIDWNFPTSSSYSHVMVEAKCYACMAVSAVCVDPSNAKTTIRIGMIPALLKMIDTRVSELSMYAAFVFHKLSMVHSAHPELSLNQVASVLMDHAPTSSSHCKTYFVSTLRRLIQHETIRSEMAAEDVLHFFSNACDLNDVDMSREIASSLCNLSLWDETKSPIAKSPILDQILTLCNSSDVETSRFALGSLANILEDPDAREMILRQDSLLHQMLGLTQMCNTPTARESIRVLANILSSVASHECFLNEDGIGIMSRVTELEDHECVLNAAVAFRKLCANSTTHQAFLSEDGITAVINLTKHESKQVRLQGLATLRDIASNPDFQLDFVEVGAMKAAIDLASDAEVDIKIVSLGIIRQLSISMRLKVQILESSVMNIIADCITNIDDSDVLYPCASTLANIAEHARNKTALVQMGTLPYLVVLCKCDSASVKRETARAFSLLSSAPENAEAFDNNVLLAVIDLLGCEEEETCRDSTSTICNIAITSEKQRVIGQFNCIPRLVQLLQCPHESCLMNSCRALCRLTCREENKVSTLDHGGMAHLLHLCNSSTENLVLATLMVLVNLSTCVEYQDEFIHRGALLTLEPLLSNNDNMLRQHALMVLCNLASHDATRDHIARQTDLLLLIDLMNDADLECKSYATMTVCNLSSVHRHGAAVLLAGGLARLTAILIKSDGVPLQRAALLATYNISTYGASHTLLAKEDVIQSIILSCRSPDLLSRRFALLILSNVACNDKTRTNAIKGGGLQAAVLALKNEDATIVRFACICLCNMANDSNTQSQILVHGGLPSLVSLSQNNDNETKECAFMCLCNLAANESNHLPLMKQGAFKAFIDAFTTATQNTRIYRLFGIVNLTSNAEMLSQIGRRGGIRLLMDLAKSQIPHIRCFALSGLRRLALIRENRERLIIEGAVQILGTPCGKTEDAEIQREIASCFCSLTLSPIDRFEISRTAIFQLSAMVNSNDPETVRLSLGAIGNLSEDIDTHICMKQANVGCSVLFRLGHRDIDIKREAARAVANLLSSTEFHPQVIQCGLDDLILLSAVSCDECRYLTALSFRKLSAALVSHNTLINNGLQNILALTKAPEMMTRKHAVTTIRDLSASNADDKTPFFKLGAIANMIELVADKEKDLQVIAVATVRHLSRCKCIKDDFSRSVLVKSVIRCICWANDDMRYQIAGLLANLSMHRECHSVMVTQGVIPALGKLSCTDNIEIIQDCGRAFAYLCANEEKQGIIYRQGGFRTLVNLSKSKCVVCQKYVAIALRFMASSTEVQRSISKENEFSSILELSTSELIDFKRSAAASIGSMSLSETGKKMILKNGGIGPILRLCVHLDLSVQREALFCIANFVGSRDLCQYVSKQGGVETLKAVVSTSNDAEILREASRTLSSLSVHIPTRAIMITQETPQALSKLAKSSDNSTQRFAALALCNLCQGTLEQKKSIVQQGTLRILLFLLRFPDLEIERCASLSIAALSLGSDENKFEVIESGFVRPLLEAITYPDVNLRQCALLALNSVSLGESERAKELIFQENGLSRLLTLVGTEDAESIHAGIFLLGTLAENMNIRDAMVTTDCVQLLTKKSSMGSIEIKRAVAYLFSVLSECPDYHDRIRGGGALESIIALASLVDDECQDYGAFTLAFLANNKSFQIQLVKLGAVRPLVSMMANNLGSKHYASLALLNLADNFENHITIAEEGGIQALLALGRSKISNENVQYKAHLTVGQMAKHAANQLMSKNNSSGL